MKYGSYFYIIYFTFNSKFILVLWSLFFYMVLNFLIFIQIKFRFTFEYLKIICMHISFDPFSNHGLDCIGKYQVCFILRLDNSST